jgi:hypothetical protein
LDEPVFIPSTTSAGVAVRGLRDQQVNVIFHRTRSDQGTGDIIHDAADVSVKILALRVGDPPLAILGGEDEVNEDSRDGL